MKKLITGFVVGTVLILCCILMLQHRDPRAFSMGTTLPPGRVTPQLSSAFDTAMLVAPDGSLWGWGGNPWLSVNLFGHTTVSRVPQRLGKDSDWQNAVVGYGHLLALKIDGSLWGMGSNANGELAQTNRVNAFPSPVRIGTEHSWCQISAGIGQSLALKSDGSLWGWGRNERGQVGNGSTLNRFAMVQIGNGRDWKSVCAGSFNSFALRKDGTIWGWGKDPVRGGTNDVLSPQQIDPSTNWVAIASANYHLLALKADGTLWFRGGDDDITAAEARSAFVQIADGSEWSEIYTGANHYFARKRDGTWWACGSNTHDQLGLAVPLVMSGPRRVPLDFEPWAFTTGVTATTLLTKDGNLWTWGKRLGTDPPRFPRPTFKDSLNHVFDVVFHKHPFKPERLPVFDRKPYLLWKLPPSVTRSLAEPASESIRVRTGDNLNRSSNTHPELN